METQQIKATRPLEYVCFQVLELPVKEGNAFVYLAVDAYSEFAFQPNITMDSKPETIIQQISLLIKDPDFVTHLYNGFTLVLNQHQELTEQIKAVIEPVNGKLLFNEAFHAEIMTPIIESMFG